MTVVLETERLVLRHMEFADVDAVAEVLSDPEAMRHYPHPLDRSQVLAWIERNQQRYAEDGHGLYCMVLRDAGTVVGDCGLVRQVVDGISEVEVGYHVRRDLWRRGYATEAARACAEYAFERLRVTRVIALVRPENVASCRVAEKIGMKVDRTTNWAGLEHRVYAVAKGAVARARAEAEQA